MVTASTLQGYNPGMKFNPQDQFSISGEVLAQQVNGETVLLDLQGESYFGLNEVGTRIWQLIGSQHSFAETLSILADEYEVDREQLKIDINELLVKLNNEGLVQRVTGV